MQTMYEISIFDGEHRLHIDKPLRLIELFAGYGSQSLALKYLGIPHEHYFISEWAVKSIQAYKDMHCHDDNKPYDSVFTDKEIRNYLKGKISADYSTPLSDEQIERMPIDKARTIVRNMFATNNLGSICSIDAKKHPIVGDYTYLLTYSFPCITADSLILTKDKGYIPMSEVEPSMEVLTKGNTFERVVKKFDNGVQPTFYLNGMGFENIRCTGKHKFLVRTMKRIGHLGRRSFSDPEFKTAEEIAKNDYFGVPIIREQHDYITTDLDFWYLAGAYIGDGWTRENDKTAVFLAGNDEKIAKWTSVADRYGVEYTIYDEPSCKKMRIKSKSMSESFLRMFGTGSANKRIPGEVLCLKNEQLQAFYNGYLESDGCVINGKHQFTSVNRQVIYSVSAIVNKLYRRPTRVYAVKTNPKGNILGREVNQQPTYMLRFNPVAKKQDHAFVDGDYVWYPFKSLIPAEDANVYNMEVENDHSYIVQGCISKNCQDLSMAGLRQGMERGSSTRSGLLWEVERLLNEWNDIGRVPDILLMENVPEVVGTKNRKAWEEWIASLDQLGYKSYWKILNATDYGIPQNRRRCFMVSVQGNYYYDHPSPIGCSLRLKDVLENKVSEDYYLSDETVAKFVRLTNGTDNSQTAIVKKGDPNIYPTNIGTTLHARDCKEGKTVGTREGINAVVEREN